MLRNVTQIDIFRGLSLENFLNTSDIGWENKNERRKIYTQGYNPKV